MYRKNRSLARAFPGYEFFVFPPEEVKIDKQENAQDDHKTRKSLTHSEAAYDKSKLFVRFSEKFHKKTKHPVKEKE